MKAARVVLVAENCSRRMGGEAVLPYHCFRLLRARGIDAHLVVHERVHEDLEALFANDLDRIHFVRDRLLQKAIFRAGRLLPHRVQEATFGLANQMLTQAAQRGIVRRLVAPGTVVHQPIPVSPRFPSLLYGLGAPVVVGPLNGGMQFPPAFRGAESWLSRVALEFGRRLANLGNRFAAGKLRAAVVLVANARTRAALPGPLRGRVIELVENGVDLLQWSDGGSTTPCAHRFLFVGRLVDWKALDLVLSAMSIVPQATLEVIGDGPMHAAWLAQAAQLGLAHRVQFVGWKTQGECAARLAQCAALVLPSLYECGGAVVLEAMAMSRPVIATAWGGPADYLDATCGILIEPTSRDSMVEGFAQAMRALIESPARAEALGAAGRKRVEEHFDWERKIEALLEVYDSALDP